MKTIKENSGSTIEEIKRIYLSTEPNGIITAAKVSFDEDIEQLQALGSISIVDNIVKYIKWIDLNSRG